MIVFLGLLLTVNCIINAFVISRMRRFQRELWEAKEEVRRVKNLVFKDKPKTGKYP